MRVKVKVTHEWEVTLKPEWYPPTDDINDIIASEMQSFKNDEYLFFEAMDSLDKNGKSSIEIKECK